MKRKYRTDIKYLVISDRGIEEFTEYKEAFNYFLENGKVFAIQLYVKL